MAVQRWLILDADGVAQNVTLWDADADPDWQPPAGFTLQLDDGTPIVAAPVEEQTSATVDALVEAVTALLDNKPAKAQAALNRARKK